MSGRTQEEYLANPPIERMRFCYFCMQTMPVWDAGTVNERIACGHPDPRPK